MAQPSQAAKDAAFRNQNRAAAVGVAAGGAAGGIALIPVAGPFIAAGVALVGAGFGIRAIMVGKIAHDPPRDDYSEVTTLPPPGVDLAVFGDSAAESAARELVRVNDEIARAFDAMLVALDRASGAELAGDRPMVDARLAEVSDFAARASQGLRESSERVDGFREALYEIRDATRAALAEAGVPLEYPTAFAAQPGTDPVSALDETLAQAAESDYEFAIVLDGLVRDGGIVEPGRG